MSPQWNAHIGVGGKALFITVRTGGLFLVTAVALLRIPPMTTRMALTNRHFGRRPLATPAQRAADHQRQHNSDEAKDTMKVILTIRWIDQCISTEDCMCLSTA
jgi:hypothetical protein